MAFHRGKESTAALSALLLAWACAPAAGADLPGRLFFTPEQRARLDQARVRNEPPPPPPVAEAPGKPKAEPPKLITVDGVVRRADGDTVVWINKRLREHEVKPVPMPGEAARIRIDLGEDLGSADLRVGQRYDRVSGRIEDAYRILPPAPPPATAPQAAAQQAAEEPRPPKKPDAPEPDAAYSEPAPATAETGEPAAAIPLTRRRY